MCGFYSILDHQQPVAEARRSALTHARRLRHRGPDWTGVFADDQVALAHERLAIVDPHHGSQPLVSPASAS